MYLSFPWEFIKLSNEDAVSFTREQQIVKDQAVFEKPDSQDGLM